MTRGHAIGKDLFVSRLALLVCADLVVGGYLIAWIVGTKIQEPYECDGLCQGAGVFAALVLAGLGIATWRAVKRSAPKDEERRQP